MTEITDAGALLALISTMRAGLVAAVNDPRAEHADAQVIGLLRQELVELNQARELYRRTSSQGPAYFEPDPEQRATAIEMLGRAVRALRSGDLNGSARLAIGACALDPEDQHSQHLVQLRIRQLTGHSAANAPNAKRLQFQPPHTPYITGSRRFQVLVDAGELIAEPNLLPAWTRHFGQDDEATLAILAAPAEIASLEQALVAALRRAGLSPDTAYDLAIVERTPSSELELARQAHAVLTARVRRWPGSLGALPHFVCKEAQLGELRRLARRVWTYGGIGRPMRIAIKIPPGDWDDAVTWGDTHFALQFARELNRRGHDARLEILPEWDALPVPPHDAPRDDLEIQLRGPFPYFPDPAAVSVLWNISRPSRVTSSECDWFDLIAAPSDRRAEELAAVTSTPVMVLPQATDATNCWPDPDPTFLHELSFVANTRQVFRQIMQDLLPTERDLAVWGRGWHGLIPPQYIAGTFLDNTMLRHAYSSAGIVLNDHMADQRAHGIVSNRIYDVLACGGCALSDHMPELESEFSGLVATYATREELRGTIDRLLADPDERAERGRRGREFILRAHTFSHRADALLNAVAPLLAAR